MIHYSSNSQVVFLNKNQYQSFLHLKAVMLINYTDLH